jgi:hypothetical protein
MLKFTYSETSLYLEHLTQNLEEWMSLRVVLSLRAGQRLVVEQCTASLLLPADLVDLHLLKTAAQSGTLTVFPCDADYVEVSLHGTWVSSQSGETEGVFVAALGDRIEKILFALWQEAQAHLPSIR